MPASRAPSGEAHGSVRFAVEHVGGVALADRSAPFREKNEAAIACDVIDVRRIEMRNIARNTASQTITTASGTLSNSGTPVLSAFSGVAIIIGLLAAVFPAKAVKVLELVWPAARSVTPPAIPTVMLFVRLAGGVFVLFGLVFLTH
jgi:hypothetical protein